MTNSRRKSVAAAVAAWSLTAAAVSSSKLSDFASLATVTGYTVSSGELELFAGEQEILTYTLAQ